MSAPASSLLTPTPDAAGLQQALDWLDAQAQARHWPARVQQALMLSLDEAFSNILRHGLGQSAQKASTGRMALRLEQDAAGIHLHLRDNGPAFDPTRHTPGTMVLSLDDAVPGGHGLRLMRHYLDALDYVRDGDDNHLTLFMTLPASTR